jgi:aldehyde dehydrogenase (NAD+)
LYGGRCEAASRFIEPTLLDEVSPESAVMQEEIFGPVFPMITFDDQGKSFSEKVIEFVNAREHPLAFYYFGKEKQAWEILQRCLSGGACINDDIMHIANEKAPFGGVGNSGMNAYHGRKSFEVFSHHRSVIATGTWIDLPFRYMPYKCFSLVKKIL